MKSPKTTMLKDRDIMKCPSYKTSDTDSDNSFETPNVHLVDQKNLDNELPERRNSLVRPLDSFNCISNKNLNGEDTPEKVSTSKKSLKSVIKSFNVRAVENFEKDYSASNKKHNQAALTLAELYISGKRAPQNFSRAIEILSASSLAEAKLLLLRLAVNLGKYTEAYYFADLLSLAK